MKKQSWLTILLVAFICSTWAISCSNNNNDKPYKFKKTTQNTEQPTPNADQPIQNENAYEPANTNAGTDGFSDGHKLSGRYQNSAAGFRYFTFYTDGTLTRAGASSGDFRGGDYVTGSHDGGTYHLSGNNLHVIYQNGDTEDLSIEIGGLHVDQNSYEKENPAQLKINHVIYTQPDE